MESTPRINGQFFPQYIGRQVFIIVDTSERRVDSYGNPVAKSTDGIDITIRLPPGERIETQFIQIEGKVMNQNLIDAFRIQPVSESFDASIYNQAVDLMLKSYNSLFA